MQIVVNLAIFVVTAVLGSMLIIKLFEGSKPPKGIKILHGGAASIGLVLLIITYARLPNPWLLASLLTFLGAAMGGSTMFFMDRKNKEIPKWLAIAHATAAITGIILLFIGLTYFFN